GSAMLPLLMHMYLGFLGDAAAPLRPRVDGEIANHLAYLESAIAGRAFFVGDDLTGADIQLTFVLEAAEASGLLKDYPALTEYLGRMQARPAYARTIFPQTAVDRTDRSMLELDQRRTAAEVIAGHAEIGSRFIRRTRLLDRHGRRVPLRQHGIVGRRLCRPKSERRSLLAFPLILETVLLLSRRELFVIGAGAI